MAFVERQLFVAADGFKTSKCKILLQDWFSWKLYLGLSEEALGEKIKFGQLYLIRQLYFERSVVVYTGGYIVPPSLVIQKCT